MHQGHPLLQSLSPAAHARWQQQLALWAGLSVTREVHSFSITSRIKVLGARSGPQATTWVALRSGEHQLEANPPNPLGAKFMA